MYIFHGISFVAIYYHVKILRGKYIMNLCLYLDFLLNLVTKTTYILEATNSIQIASSLV